MFPGNRNSHGIRTQRFKNGNYYLHLPARDGEGIFRIGVTEADKPEGPFMSSLYWIRETNQPIVADDHDERFFEAVWVHEHKGKYFLTYSTARRTSCVMQIGNNPLGPFT